MCGHKPKVKVVQQTAPATAQPQAAPVQQSAVSVSAPTESATSETVVSEAQSTRTRAKGKRRLTINTNSVGTGVNI